MIDYWTHVKTRSKISWMLDMDMEMVTDMDNDDVSPSLPLLQPWAQTLLKLDRLLERLNGLSGYLQVYIHRGYQGVSLFPYLG
jgi:hypothetical protein